MTTTMQRPAVTAPPVAPRKTRRWLPWLYLAPALGLLVAFTYVPVGNMVYYSFTSWDGLDATMEPVGLDNYVRVFTDERYWRVFLISGYYFVASFAQIAIALYFAVILSFNTRFRNLFKGILFFPYLLNGVAVGFVFLYLFQPGGTLDTVLGWAGLGEHTRYWLGDPDIANISLAGTSVWRFTGLSFVLFLGAIQSIPGEIYEAAEIDGAGDWHKFRHIIMPGIRRIISLSFILAISGSLAVFEIPFIMTGGANGTRTFVVQAYETAFQFRQIGLASAMAVVLLLVVLLITWIQRRLVPDEEVTLS
ncbi:sugar ABC transporter permease [Actinoplanes sp. NPDC023936]|uniref:carbohydrate ABC transporter permease n=1 Tax=Actinoplanes sp. NPDC023936 TaxID=3154910 RepID=UPI0033D577FA